MPITPPPPGRVDGWPQWPGELSSSSMSDFFTAWKRYVAERIPWNYASVAQALQSMASDGLAPGRLFTVAGDPAVHVLTNGTPTRIGAPPLIAAGIVTYTWAAGSTWSATKTVDLGSLLGGYAPDSVQLTAMEEGGGSGASFWPIIVTSGGIAQPDVTTARFRTRARATQALGTEGMERSAFWLAVARTGGD